MYLPKVRDMNLTELELQSIQTFLMIDNKFEIGCAAAKNFLKTCPPAPGTYTTNIPLDKPFKAIKSKAGAAGAFIGSVSVILKNILVLCLKL